METGLPGKPVRWLIFLPWAGGASAGAAVPRLQTGKPLYVIHDAHKTQGMKRVSGALTPHAAAAAAPHFVNAVNAPMHQSPFEPTPIYLVFLKSREELFFFAGTFPLHGSDWGNEKFSSKV